MEPEEKKEDNSKDFGKVIDALHSKQKLSSLRTYQGDMAEFIKEKNESVISIAVKEKEGKEEEEEKEKKENLKPIGKMSSKKERFSINLTMLFLGIILLVGGAVAAIYIFQFAQKEPVAEVVIEQKIIPYNNLVTLVNVTKDTLKVELSRLNLSNGITVVKITNSGGAPIQKANDLFNFLEISIPATLERTLKDEYAIGIIYQNNQPSYFLVISVNDFGQAFSGMLDWENNMVRDLSFLNTEVKADATNNTATSTATTTIALPLIQNVFNWKDIIIKNKDTRGLVNEKGQSKIAYTFLDKSTILIVSNLSAIGDISSAYASRAVAR